MVLVDSSAWIDFFRGRDCAQTRRLDELLHRHQVLTGDLILAEVLQGFRDELQCRRTRRWLGRLAYADLAGREVALQAATNHRLLRRQGVTVRKTIDMLIATFCIRNGHSLLYTDQDFDPMAKHLGLLKA